MNISKNIMFYFYFKPIIGPEFESGSDQWTGECGPELTILTAHMVFFLNWVHAISS